MLSQEPNCCSIATPTEASPLTVVGDLHGSINDLNAIITKYGPPGPRSRYLFNGDFVDRGEHSCEVLLVLCAFKALYPEYVHLNRGNHEDVLINQAYGFAQELERKYPGAGMLYWFGELFKALPLCCIVGEGTTNAVFVVHGGMPQHPETGIPEIQQIQRHKYNTVSMGASGQPGLQCMMELMWSDPTEDGRDGIHPSGRGSFGCEFGPDVLASFLGRIQCTSMVRSHEAIDPDPNPNPNRPSKLF